MLDLDWNEWFVALLFGIALDLDHLFAVPGYVDRNGLGAILRPSWDDGSGASWRSLLHYPIGSFVIIPLAVGWRLLLPLLFWSTHLLIDYVQAATLSYAALVESVFLSVTCAMILAVWYHRWRVAQGTGGLGPFLAHIRDTFAYYARRNSSRETSGRT